MRLIHSSGMYMNAACSPPPVRVAQLVDGERGGHQLGLPCAAKPMLRTLGTEAVEGAEPHALKLAIRRSAAADKGQERFRVNRLGRFIVQHPAD